MLSALDVETGCEQWRSELGGLHHSTIVVVGDTVALSSHEDLVDGADARTGDPRWTFDTSTFGAFADSLTAAGGEILFTLSDGTLHALNPATGAAQTRFRP